MKSLYGNSPLERELQRVKTEERRYLRKRREQKESKLNALLESKVPPTLQSTLDSAFAGAFSLIFDKGTGVIEKTYNKRRLESNSRDSHREILRRQDRRSLRNVSEKAGSSGVKNMVVSGAAGIGMGVAGMGLPDIPLFTAMLLKSVYELALRYGFSYESEGERYFILLLLQGAVAPWEELQEIEEKLDVYMETELLPLYYSRQTQIRKAAAGLSRELLYMKFLQGVPIVGAIGGAYDIVYMKKVTEYAELKYRRRFYLRMMK